MLILKTVIEVHQDPITQRYALIRHRRWFGFIHKYKPYATSDYDSAPTLASYTDNHWSLRKAMERTRENPTIMQLKDEDKAVTWAARLNFPDRMPRPRRVFPFTS